MSVRLESQIHEVRCVRVGSAGNYANVVKAINRINQFARLFHFGLFSLVFLCFGFYARVRARVVEVVTARAKVVVVVVVGGGGDSSEAVICGFHPLRVLTYAERQELINII